MKNAVRRLDGYSVKKEETAHNISAKLEKSETSSEAEEPKPVIQKFLHEGKPVAPENNEPNIDPKAGLDDEPNVAANDASDATKTNKPKPKKGKFAKWQNAIEKAFELVSEDDVEYMYFEITGSAAKVMISRGRNPYIQQLK